MYLLLIYFLIPIIPLIVMPRYIISHKMSPYRTVLQAVIIIMAAAAVIFMAASLSGQGIFSQMHELTKDMSKEFANNPMIVDAFKQTEVSEADRIKMFEQIYDQAFKVLPACIMVMGAVAAYIEYIIISNIMSRRKQVEKMPKFRYFSFPNSAFMGIVGMYFASWVLTRTGVLPNDMLYMNMDVIFDFAFALQGISVVMMFCHMKRIPKALGVVAAIVLWMTLIGKTLLVMLGMLDMVFGFKERIQNMNGRVR